jgi:ribosomal-protein-alanine N-acetyltransferase
MKSIETPRLTLRTWKVSDIDALHGIHADPEVAYWLAGALSREQIEASVHAMIEHNSEHDWGVFAVCLKDGSLIGAAGLQRVKPFMPFSGIEATWRLASSRWGAGYITEAMRPIIEDGFERLAIDEIVTFTSQSNLKSQAVMKRLGFVADSALDFDHPKLPESHPLRRHVFFRLPR